MADYTSHLDTLPTGLAQPEPLVNSLANALSPASLFGRRDSTSAALTWGYYGGVLSVSGVPTTIANGTVTLTASSTNYVEATTAGVVSKNTVGFTSGRIPLYTVTTNTTGVTNYVDQRVSSLGLSGTVLGGATADINAINGVEDFVVGSPSQTTIRANWTVSNQTGTSDTVADSDRGSLLTYSNASAIAVTLPQAGAASSFASGWLAMFQNRGAGTVTITPTTSTIDGAASLTLRAGDGVVIVSDGTNYFTMRGRTTRLPVTLTIAASDETTSLTAGGNKVRFRMPHAMTLESVRASLNVAASSGLCTVDINESGSTILSTKLTFDAGETTTTTAVTPAVISDTALADDAEISIDVDSIGSGSIAPAGLKVSLIGYRTL